MREMIMATKITNNAEYRAFVKSKMRALAILAVIGAVTLVAGLLAEFVWKVEGMDHTLGIYTGLGTGLFGAGVFLWIKHYLLLKKGEDKIKEERLRRFDERTVAVSSRAFRMATFIMLIGMYAFCLIGAFWYPQLVSLLCIFVIFLLVAYCICYWYYNRKM